MQSIARCPSSFYKSTKWCANVSSYLSQPPIATLTEWQLNRPASTEVWFCPLQSLKDPRTSYSNNSYCTEYGWGSHKEELNLWSTKDSSQRVRDPVQSGRSQPELLYLLLHNDVLVDDELIHVKGGHVQQVDVTALRAQVQDLTVRWQTAYWDLLESVKTRGVGGGDEIIHEFIHTLGFNCTKMKNPKNWWRSSVGLKNGTPGLQIVYFMRGCTCKESTSPLEI